MNAYPTVWLTHSNINAPLVSNRQISKSATISHALVWVVYFYRPVFLEGLWTIFLPHYVFNGSINYISTTLCF